MSAPVPPTDHPDAVRRGVRHELHGRLAMFSAAVWTVGTLLLFVMYAAGSPRPIPMAVMAMLVPLVPALLPWLFFRPLVEWLAARRLRDGARAAGRR